MFGFGKKDAHAAPQPAPVAAQNHEAMLAKLEESIKTRLNTVSAVLMAEIRKANAEEPQPPVVTAVDPVATALAHIDDAMKKLAADYQAAVQKLEAKKAEIVAAKTAFDKVVAGE